MVHVRRLIGDVIDPKIKTDFSDIFSTDIPQTMSSSPFRNQPVFNIVYQPQQYEAPNVSISGDVSDSQLAVGNNNTVDQSKNNLSTDTKTLVQDLKALLNKFSEPYNVNSAVGQDMIKEAVLAELKQNPTFKSRTTKALKAAGEQALIEAINHPVAKVAIKGIKGFLEG